jgi:hypothetical protein
MARVYREVMHDSGVGHGANIIGRIIYIIGGFIVTILGLRFVFSLLGANRGNVIADFVYDTSRPLLEPFFGLFNYQPQFGAVRFEFETLIAIIVYGAVFMLIARLFTPNDTI